MPTTALTLVDATGAEHVLTDGAPLFVLLGLEGIYMPPVDLVEEGIPRQPGARLRETRYAARDIDLPLRLTAATPAALIGAMRALLRWFAASGDRPLTLRHTGADGAQREIACRYVSGLDPSDDLGAWRTDWRTTVVLRAHDPFWSDRNERTGNYGVGTVAGSFFPIPPLRLASSTVFAAPTIANDGDVDAWPVWTIVGPATNPALRNLTTGKTLTIAGTLAAGATLTIDTRPRTDAVPTGKSVVGDGGANWFPNLAPGAALWPLRPGTNAVQIELSGASSRSVITYTLKPRYLSV